MTKTLTIADFERYDSMRSLGHYYETTLPDGSTICLESCMDGYCVGKYDRGSKYSDHKRCTNLGSVMDFPLDGSHHEEALAKAIDLANTYL